MLFIRKKGFFDVVYYLKKLALIAKNSKEYQGHGWGLAYFDEQKNKFVSYHNLAPIWQDNLGQFADIKTRILFAHARSAFQDKDIDIRNNMPFLSSGENLVFMFNGELRGVRIREKGRIGAEKIFNLIKKFIDDEENKENNISDALKRAVELLKKRTKYIRAMNIIIGDKNRVCYYSLFNEDADYFTMHLLDNGRGFILCSEEFGSPGEKFKPLSNDSFGEK